MRSSPSNRNAGRKTRSARATDRRPRIPGSDWDRCSTSNNLEPAPRPPTPLPSRPLRNQWLRWLRSRRPAPICAQAAPSRRDEHRAGHPDDSRWANHGGASDSSHASARTSRDRTAAPHNDDRLDICGNKILESGTWHRAAQRIGRCAHCARRQRQNDRGNRTSHDGLHFFDLELDNPSVSGRHFALSTTGVEVILAGER
jgi:hypothetical protein